MLFHDYFYSFHYFTLKITKPFILTSQNSNKFATQLDHVIISILFFRKIAILLGKCNIIENFNIEEAVCTARQRKSFFMKKYRILYPPYQCTVYFHGIFVSKNLSSLDCHCDNRTFALCYTRCCNTQCCNTKFLVVILGEVLVNVVATK